MIDEDIRKGALQAPVTLFQGPAGGNAHIDVKLALRGHIALPDYMEVTLTSEQVPTLQRFLSQLPLVDTHRVAVVDISKTVPVVLNRLLTTLEHLPGSSHCVLVSCSDVPTTISTRSQAIPVPLLSRTEVLGILRARGYNDRNAQDIADKARGDMSLTYQIAGLSDIKEGVTLAINHVVSANHRALDALATYWSKEHTNLLLTACRERIIERFTMFTEKELEALPKATALKILTTTAPDTRPRLVVRGSLIPIARGL